ncbi:MAG: hypothetical protein WC700_10155 [Gemmatimonadaceae bacterium]|jgi:hypothetical protein
MQIDVPPALDFAAANDAAYVAKIATTPAARKALEDLQTQYEGAADKAALRAASHAPATDKVVLRAASHASAAVVLTAILRRWRLAGVPTPVDLSAFSAVEQLPRYDDGPIMYFRMNFLNSLSESVFDALDAPGTTYFGDPEAVFLGKQPKPWDDEPSGMLAAVLWAARYVAGVPFNHAMVDMLDPNVQRPEDGDEDRRRAEHDVSEPTGAFHVTVRGRVGSALWISGYPPGYKPNFESASTRDNSQVPEKMLYLTFRWVHG